MVDEGRTTSFYLADWYVDTDSNRVCRGDIEVKLESKVMAVLAYLAEHSGELVSREDLESAVWGQTIVGYDALTRCIAKLRKALNDDPRQPRYIETISKKGYRLIARIRAVDTGVVSNAHEAMPSQSGITFSRAKTVAMIAVAMLIAGLSVLTIFPYMQDSASNQSPMRGLELPSIVVLPFDNLSDDPEQRYFSDGMTADISTALSKLSGMFVIAQTSANSYRGRTSDVGDIAGALGTRYVLEGSVRRADKRIRVNVQLIDASRKVYLWSEKYDRESRDIFAVQDDIVENIVAALSVKLTEEEKQRSASKFTASIEAYDDFLKGQSLYMQFNRERNLQARQFYQRAIDRDDFFSRAYSAMALTYVVEHRYGWINDIQNLISPLFLAPFHRRHCGLMPER